MSSLPVIEPDNVVAAAWAALATFSQDQIKQAVGKEVVENMQSMMSSYPVGSNDRLYLAHVNNLFLNALRSLSNRLDGMNQYFQLSNDVEQARLKQAQALGSVSGDASSLIPRASATVGGVSIAPVIAKVSNVTIPTVAGISGYELLLFGAFVGYFAAELFLRLYSLVSVPRIIRAAQLGRHVAYNRFLRESKEVLVNLALDVIRLREQFYSNVSTLGNERFFYGTSPGIASRQELEDYVSDMVDRVTPSINEDVGLRRHLGRGGSRFARQIRLEAGDFLVGSYSVDGGKPINVFLMEGELPAEHDIVASNCEYASLNQVAGEFRISAREKGDYTLVLENGSRLRSRLVTYSIQIIHRSLLPAFPRDNKASPSS